MIPRSAPVLVDLRGSDTWAGAGWNRNRVLRFRWRWRSDASALPKCASRVRVTDGETMASPAAMIRTALMMSSEGVSLIRNARHRHLDGVGVPPRTPGRPAS